MVYLYLYSYYIYVVYEVTRTGAILNATINLCKASAERFSGMFRSAAKSNTVIFSVRFLVPLAATCRYRFRGSGDRIRS